MRRRLPLRSLVGAGVTVLTLGGLGCPAGAASVTGGAGDVASARPGGPLTAAAGAVAVAGPATRVGHGTAAVTGLSTTAPGTRPTAAPEESSSGEVTPDIIPEPNSGQRPDSPGDRGGAQQSVLFVAICVALVLVGVLAFLDGRRHKRRARRSGAVGSDAGRSPVGPAAGRPTPPS